jgi:flagellar basal-body rod protein FlgG
MDPLTVAAASGLRSRMETLSILANNLANATTTGYKNDKEFYGLFASEDADNPSGSIQTLPTVERQWTDFSQGTLQNTGNALDVALSGPGFFAVNGPGGTLYTRNGNFQTSSTGVLTTSDGLPVRGEGGAPIQLSPDRPVEITSSGSIHQGGRPVGQLEIVDFKSTAALEKAGGSNFRNTDARNAPITVNDAQIRQGKLESSNVSVSESAMQLVGVMRQFEMLQKAVLMGVDMNAKAIQEVARVNP